MFNISIRPIYGNPTQERINISCKSFDIRPAMETDVYVVTVFGTDWLHRQFPHRSDAGECIYTKDLIYVR